ncbi:enoyl-CoA hydratase/isomerase family protein [Natrinema gelatinilyticum]|uniref:enoyl-CoA hydratase/isomerase family protein n=1 Tax=Natrinema gelatinilyticum TaxID=2961571 RepID=UPI0020C3A10E|nr:enoyl-CoA hydratase/isomerase family protein [Natrinema gelatinilyticum]
MIRYDLDGKTARIAIDRPEKKNALSPETHRELTNALDRADDDARVAVLTGTGDAFCAGSDIEALRGANTAADAESLIDPEYRLHRRIESLSIPVIAAVNGTAYGGGFELVTACDLAVATADATFALPETRLGLTPGYALDRGIELVGRKRILELALTGDEIDAVTAREWGLVNRVVDPDGLEAAVDDLASDIAAAPARTVAAVKRTVTEDITERVSYQRSTDRLAALLASAETRARIDAFFEGRADDSDD